MPAWKGSGEEARNGETRRHDPHVQPLPFLLPFRTFCCSCCRDLSTSCFRPRLTALVFVHHGPLELSASSFVATSPPRRAFPPVIPLSTILAIPFPRDSIFCSFFLDLRTNRERETRGRRRYRVFELEFVSFFSNKNFNKAFLQNRGAHRGR